MCGRRAAGIKAADRGASGVVRLQSQARHWVVKMGEEGRVYLSAAELSPVYPPKQVQLVLERIWFESGQLLRETTPSGIARVAARITRKNTARSLYRLKRSWQTSVRRRLIGCFLRCEPKRGQKGRRGNQPSRWLKNQIPLQTDQSDEHRPAFSILP